MMDLYFTKKTRDFFGYPTDGLPEGPDAVRTNRFGFKWNFIKETNIGKYGKWHLLGSLFIALVLVAAFWFLFNWQTALMPIVACLTSWVIGGLWEVFDGWKPWYIYGNKQPAWKQELLYSNGFSFADWLNWDFNGAVSIGFIFAFMLYILLTLL